MANMSYCMFENTYNDLMQCYEALSNEKALSEREEKFKKKLIDLCTDISLDFGEEEDGEEEVGPNDLVL